jgi:thiopurine S-methyltransferase
MNREFWLERWQNNEIGFHQEEVNAHLQQFWEKMGLPPDAGVFVPLCGKSRDLLWLRAQGHRVLGIEISPLAVEAFFTENRLEPACGTSGSFVSFTSDGLELLCGDFFELDPERLRDVKGVYDRASLVALPPSLREKYAQKMKSLLPASTPVLLVTMDYPQGEMDGPPFSVSGEEVEALYGDRYRIELLYSKDILEENPRFREKGLTRLTECVYALRPR